jgi:hypothetical protein
MVIEACDKRGHVGLEVDGTTDARMEGTARIENGARLVRNDRTHVAPE